MASPVSLNAHLTHGGCFDPRGETLPQVRVVSRGHGVSACPRAGKVASLSVCLAARFERELAARTVMCAVRFQAPPHSERPLVTAGRLETEPPQTNHGVCFPSPLAPDWSTSVIAKKSTRNFLPLVLRLKWKMSIIFFITLSITSLISTKCSWFLLSWHGVQTFIWCLCYFCYLFKQWLGIKWSITFKWDYDGLIKLWLDKMLLRGKKT